MALPRRANAAARSARAGASNFGWVIVAGMGTPRHNSDLLLLRGNRSPLLKRRGFDHACQQSGESTLVSFELLNDPVDGLHVIIFGPTAQCIGEELFRQAEIEVPPPR